MLGILITAGIREAMRQQAILPFVIIATEGPMTDHDPTTVAHPDDRAPRVAQRSGGMLVVVGAPDATTVPYPGAVWAA